MDQAAQMMGDGTGADALRHALMESRPRWRQFGAIPADRVLETADLGHMT